MNCKKTRELLLTDYLDGELNQSLCSRIQQHLDGCIHCKQFEQEIQMVRVPFKEARCIEPQTKVWQCIHKRIQAEQMLPQGSLFECLLEGLRGFLLVYRQPVFAATAVALTIILAVILVPPQKQDVLDIVAEDFVSLVDEGNGAGYDFGTDIEEYFL